MPFRKRIKCPYKKEKTEVSENLDTSEEQKFVKMIKIKIKKKDSQCETEGVFSKFPAYRQGNSYLC